MNARIEVRAHIDIGVKAETTPCLSFANSCVGICGGVAFLSRNQLAYTSHLPGSHLIFGGRGRVYHARCTDRNIKTRDPLDVTDLGTDEFIDRFGVTNPQVYVLANP